MDTLHLNPLNYANGSIRLPGSKSLSNRALLLAALSKNECLLKHLLKSDDITHMIKALKQLGVQLSDKKGGILVKGEFQKIPNASTNLFLGNAGTAMRPLTAVLSAIPQKTFILDGEARMHERPIYDLVDALRNWGAQIEYLESEGFPPLKIASQGLQGGVTRVKGNVSSQFLTSLLLAAPLCKNTARIEVDGELVSTPYVEMTVNLLERFGITVQRDQTKYFEIASGQSFQSPSEFFIEGDASSASYFLAAAAIAGGTIRVEGVGNESVQGDAHFADVLEKMGAIVKKDQNWIEVSKGSPLKAIDTDMKNMPDAAMTLAALALFVDGPMTISGIANWRVKETDRMQAMANELSKVGAQVQTFEDAIRVTPPTKFLNAQIETYNDHRMAMSLSLAAFGGSALDILDPNCTSKTFPDYFEVLKSISQ